MSKNTVFKHANSQLSNKKIFIIKLIHPDWSIIDTFFSLFVNCLGCHTVHLWSSYERSFSDPQPKRNQVKNRDYYLFARMLLNVEKRHSLIIILLGDIVLSTYVRLTIAKLHCSALIGGYS